MTTVTDNKSLGNKSPGMTVTDWLHDCITDVYHLPRNQLILLTFFEVDAKNETLY